MEKNEYIEKVKNKLNVYFQHVQNVNLTRSQKSRLTVILMLCMFMYLFSIQTSQSHYSGNEIDNNFGLDCEELSKAVKRGDKEESIKNRFYDIVLKHDIPLAEGGVHQIQYRPLLNCLEADDPYLAHVLKNQLMLPPSSVKKPYEIYLDKYLEMKNSPQAVDVMEMVYKNKLKRGFFVEAGAGECAFSVSLPLEFNHRWTGVLVEAVPQLYKQCTEVNRKAWLLNACLGMDDKPTFTEFNTFSTGRIKRNDTKKDVVFMGGFAKEDEPSVKLQCFPLQAILSALNNPVVNLFVLDIEGFELAVLRSIPWNKVNVEVLSVETDLAGEVMKDSSKEAIISLMEKNGYTRFAHRNDWNPNTKKEQNDMFVRNDIVKKYNVVQL